MLLFVHSRVIIYPHPCRLRRLKIKGVLPRIAMRHWQGHVAILVFSAPLKLRHNHPRQLGEVFTPQAAHHHQRV